MTQKLSYDYFASSCEPQLGRIQCARKQARVHTWWNCRNTPRSLCSYCWQTPALSCLSLVHVAASFRPPVSPPSLHCTSYSSRASLCPWLVTMQHTFTAAGLRFPTFVRALNIRMFSGLPHTSTSINLICLALPLFVVTSPQFLLRRFYYYTFLILSVFLSSFYVIDLL